MAVVLGLAGLWMHRENGRALREAAQRVSFVNQVSHELKTPLTNVRLYAELLEDHLPEEDGVAPPAVGGAPRRVPAPRPAHHERAHLRARPEEHARAAPGARVGRRAGARAGRSVRAGVRRQGDRRADRRGGSSPGEDRRGRAGADPRQSVRQRREVRPWGARCASAPGRSAAASGSASRTAVPGSRPPRASACSSRSCASAAAVTRRFPAPGSASVSRAIWPGLHGGDLRCLPSERAGERGARFELTLAVEEVA